MTRRCSYCSNNGHNSRTCPSKGGGGSSCVKLFGVRLTDGSIIKKSASMGNLSAHYNSSSSAAASPNPSSPSSDPFRDPFHVPDGYLSDDPAHATCSSNRRAERKKGVPWTEEEHRLFLLGLQKLGKGDWRGISFRYGLSLFLCIKFCMSQHSCVLACARAQTNFGSNLVYLSGLSGDHWHYINVIQKIKDLITLSKMEDYKTTCSFKKGMTAFGLNLNYGHR
uniref:HTH myb-type domain-containing protein n=1 Tax=Davidia involucrata TaxID=16924 RepID=A0A5B7AZT8_DAVIN